MSISDELRKLSLKKKDDFETSLCLGVAANNIDDLEKSEHHWRECYKAVEQSWMVLKDQYSQLAHALGAPTDVFFGDAMEDHETVLKRAADLKQQNQELGWRLEAALHRM